MNCVLNPGNCITCKLFWVAPLDFFFPRHLNALGDLKIIIYEKGIIVAVKHIFTQPIYFNQVHLNNNLMGETCLRACRLNLTDDLENPC